MKLKGKVALITGGGSGIGAAVAERFVADGAKVVITGRREEQLEKVVNSLPSGTALKCRGDVSKAEDVAQMVETTLTINGGIDILVNCAGLSVLKSITNITLEEWHQTFAINLDGPFMLMQATIPHMIKGGGGSIINISSLAALRHMTDAPAYCSSKAALNVLSRQVAIDYGPQKIRCNVICPGFVKTEMTEGFSKLAEEVGTDLDTFIANIFKNIPLRHPEGGDKIASVCSFLASEDSAYMTGVVIPVDGGTNIVDTFGAGISRAITELSSK